MGCAEETRTKTAETIKGESHGLAATLCHGLVRRDKGSYSLGRGSEEYIRPDDPAQFLLGHRCHAWHMSSKRQDRHAGERAVPCCNCTTAQNRAAAAWRHKLQPLPLASCAARQHVIRPVGTDAQPLFIRLPMWTGLRCWLWRACEYWIE